jgi:hypothetical protein
MEEQPMEEQQVIP